MALSASFSTSASALQVYINTNDATLYVRYVSLKNCLLSQIVLPAAVPTHYYSTFSLEILRGHQNLFNLKFHVFKPILTGCCHVIYNETADSAQCRCCSNESGQL